MYSGSRISNGSNTDDAPIDFSQSSVLGLDNPLTLEGLTDTWNVSKSTVVIVHVVMFS